jgi:hypothetical protein
VRATMHPWWILAHTNPGVEFCASDEMRIRDLCSHETWACPSCLRYCRMRTPRRSSILLAALAGAVSLAACGGSAAESGQVVIEEQLADEIGLGDLDATCNEPEGLSEGETFTCTATTTEGDTIEFLGTMTSDDEFEIVTTNLLLASDVETIREEGARVLSAEVGSTIVPEDIECAEGSVVLDDVGDFRCTITDTATGDVYDLTVSTGGLEPGVGVRELSFQIGDAPL